MKSQYLFAILILFFSTNTYSQDYLQSSKDSIIYPDLSEGIPVREELQFLNFEDNLNYKYIDGLSEEDKLITSKSNTARIVIRLDNKNIGRVVLYSRIFNAKDSSRYNPLNYLEGKVTISAYRRDVKVEELSKSRDFAESGFQQFHFNTFRQGIDKVEIAFQSRHPDFRFLVEKLKVIPYTKKGSEKYRNVEKLERNLNTWTDSISQSAADIKAIYTELLPSIENYYNTLTTIISGQKFQDVARARSISLNPFTDDKFVDVYAKMLEKASEQDRQKFEKLSRELKPSTNLTQVAMSLDNIILGGKFSSMINLIDGLFDTRIMLKTQSAEELEILAFDGQYFSKDQKMLSKNLKLTPVGKDLVKQITVVKTENQAMAKYMRDISEFIQSDAEYYKMIAEDAALAKRLKEEIEVLINTIIDDCLIDGSEEMMDEKVNFTIISTMLQTKFDDEVPRKTAEMWLLKSSSIKNVKRFNDLKSEYYEMISLIKMHYDVIYEVNPASRLTHFDDVPALDSRLKKDWVEKQQALITEYTKEDGLQELLSKASGKDL